MRKLLMLWGVLVMLGLTLIYTAGETRVEAAPASYETTWSPAMNQTSYWLPWQCTKYENHNGHIPAQYDAAIIKDGSSVVKVYPDLTSTGAFTATGAINPNNGKPYQAPHSWVMKCKFPPEQTTTTTSTTSTTTTTTTEPEQTTTTTTQPETTTTWPDTTSSTTTTSPAVTTTTVSDTTSTSSPTTSLLNETSTTTTPDTTVVSTTTPPSEPNVNTTPPTSDGPTSGPTLPATGPSATLWTALMGSLLLASGWFVTRLARR